tara:strand:- start:375 stop:1427 length:1053 start_codon:yes stop_codon:yes gene_type:complete
MNKSLKKYSILKKDCLKWMSDNKNTVDCVVTSPPYNLDVKYGDYDDSMPRKDYLLWMDNVALKMKHCLKKNGQIFLNIGYTNVDPFIAMDVAMVFRKHFILQNQFTWVKHIAVNDTGYGQYKPITSKRFVSVTNENIFHFTKKGDVEIDRLSIGQRNKTHPIWPELYSEGRHVATTRRSIARLMKFENYKDVQNNATDKQKKEFYKAVEKRLKEKPYQPDKLKCIGNCWYIPYTPTSKLSKLIGNEGDVNSRKAARANHPATFPPALPEKCIKISGIKKGSLIYDPFVGTGTTIVEAVKLGMIGVGTDISKNFCDFAKKRVEYELKQRSNKTNNNLNKDKSNFSKQASLF